MPEIESSWAVSTHQLLIHTFCRRHKIGTPALTTSILINTKTSSEPISNKKPIFGIKDYKAWSVELTPRLTSEPTTPTVEPSSMDSSTQSKPRRKSSIRSTEKSSPKTTPSLPRARNLLPTTPNSGKELKINNLS